MKNWFYFLFVLSIPSIAQTNKSVVIGSMIARPNALLILNPPDGNQGFLAPQLTTAERESMQPASPLEDGLLIFDTTENSFYFWKDNTWVKGLGDTLPTLQYDPSTYKLNLGSANEVDLSNLKDVPAISGQAGKFLTTNGAAVLWATPPAPTADLSLIGTTLNLTNDLTPVDLSSLFWTGSNITDGSIGSADLASSSILPGKLAPGTANTVLTTNGGGTVTWIAPSVSPDAQDLSITGNVLSLTNDGTPVNLNIVTTNGQVTGTLNSLTVANNSVTNAQIQNNAITVNKLVTSGITDANKIYSTDAGGTPQLELKSNLISGVTATGDLSGTYPSPTVTKIQGNAISAGALAVPDAGKILVWNGAQWTPQIISGASPVSQYTMIDPSDFTNLRRSDKKDKDNIIVFDDNSAYVTTIKKDEGPQIIAPVHLPHGATLEQVTLFYMDREVNNVSFNLLRKVPAGTNQNVINSWSSTGSSAAIQSSVHTPIPGNGVIDNNNYSYRIVISLDQSIDVNDSNDANLRVYAVKLKFLP